MLMEPPIASTDAGFSITRGLPTRTQPDDTNATASKDLTLDHLRFEDPNVSRDSAGTTFFKSTVANTS